MNKYYFNAKVTITMRYDHSNKQSRYFIEIEKDKKECTIELGHWQIVHIFDALTLKPNRELHHGTITYTHYN